MKVNIKRLHSHAVIPTYAHEDDGGLDLTATEIISNTADQVVYGTGLSMEIPAGFVGELFPRSSIRKYDLFMANSVGVVDATYRGEVQVTFNKKYPALPNKMYSPGDRIAQLIIKQRPQIEFVEVDELSTTERGEGGHGSTGA